MPMRDWAQSIYLGAHLRSSWNSGLIRVPMVRSNSRTTLGPWQPPVRPPLRRTPYVTATMGDEREIEGRGWGGRGKCIYICVYFVEWVGGCFHRLHS